MNGSQRRDIENRWQKGFTLVELLMAIFVSSIVMAGIFSSYQSQQKNQTAQDAVAQMQQNLRAALLGMTRDFREAKCDPTGMASARILKATAGQFQFTRDIKGDAVNPNEADGDVNDADENVIWGFSAAIDSDGNGIPGAAGADDWANPSLLGKTAPDGNFKAVAENIAAVEFSYILEDGTISVAPPNSKLNTITGVQVTLLARSERIDQNFTDTQTYRTATNIQWGPFNDGYRRRFEIVTIQIRN